jgi:hypothetical protein
MTIYILYLLLIVIIVFCTRKSKEHFEDAEAEVDECIDEDNKIVKLKSKPKHKYTDKKEVFLIYNKLNYLEAKDICKLYSGRLAKESDLDTAFQNGANWCNWGWIEGKKIAYPVQEKYWEDIEKVHKGHCGPTAGINKISNIDPLKKYSVNCYGIKPHKNKLAIDLDSNLPKKKLKGESLEERIKKCKMSKKEKEARKKAKQLKKNVRIVNFNKYKWSLVENK